MVIELSVEDAAAIERLQGLGFERDLCVVREIYAFLVSVMALPYC